MPNPSSETELPARGLRGSKTAKPGTAAERGTRSRSPATKFDSLPQEVFLNLWRTYDRLRMIEDELFAMFDLTPQQYNVLRLLQPAGERGMATLQIAARLVSRAPDITRMLDKLEARGWIGRVRPADNRRTVRARLTASGRKLIAEIARPLEKCHQRQLGHLSDRQLQQLIQLLRAARGPHEEPDSPWRLGPGIAAVE